MEYIKFEEEHLISRTLNYFKQCWLHLLIFFIVSLAGMVFAQFTFSSYFAEKTGLFLVFFFLYLGSGIGSIFCSIKFIKKSIDKNCYDRNALLLIYFIQMFVVGLFFSALFLIVEKSVSSAWFLKTTFLSIALMITYWAVLAFVFFSRKFLKK